MDNSVARSIYDEALRACGLQDSKLADARRASTVSLSVATLAGALFASQGHHKTWAVGLAGAAFGILVFTVAMVHRPREWFDAPTVGDLVWYYIDSPEAPDGNDQVVRDLALLHAGYWKTNEEQLRAALRWLVANLVALGFLVGFLFLDRVMTS